MSAFLTYASALYLTFAVDHAVDVFLFDHYEGMRGPGGTYQMLLVAGIPIALGSALLFFLGMRLLRRPGSAALRPRSASVLSGVAVALVMFSVAHVTEWIWGQESVLAHSIDLMAMILLSLGSGGLAAEPPPRFPAASSSSRSDSPRCCTANREMAASGDRVAAREVNP